MPQTCTVCRHPERAVIDAALVRCEMATRDIAGRFAVSKSAADRHRKEHLPASLVKAKGAAEVADADDLLRQVGALRSKALSLLLQAEKSGDLRTALSGIREARSCIELLARLAGELNDAPVVNITVNPVYVELRSVIVESLAPYPAARIAVAEALAAREAHHA